MPPGICAHRDGVERAVSDILGADRLEVVGDLVQELLVEVNAVAQLLECAVKRLGRGLGRAAGEGRDGRVDNVGSGLDAFQIGHERHARSAVRVHDDRQVDRVLQRSYEVICGLGRQNTGHILDAYGADAHLRHLLCKFHIAVERVDWACGV